MARVGLRIRSGESTPFMPSPLTRWTYSSVGRLAPIGSSAQVREQPKTWWRRKAGGCPSPSYPGMGVSCSALYFGTRWSLGPHGRGRCEQPDLSTALPTSPGRNNSWLGFWREVIRSSRMVCPAFRTAPASKRAAGGVTVPLSVGSYGLRPRLRHDLCPLPFGPCRAPQTSAERGLSGPQCPGLCRVTAKVVFGHGDTAQVPPPLADAAKVGKIGRLLFSLFHDFS